ncbi:lipid-A-disaccharide synthase [Neopusillimonas aromaticivorans]|uniref:lipid-A-disaccharide synthase n=1 Tax=Neopusillimonas aromaticivorans TaxID=2979868 RepID=UPI002595F0EE|nr:lipid-A-disaccharide synthase [Neopusillimonas aromaticivorans]WJJ93662.1 lipid-A-disaccharide synthase [Neopusillimonas aromaticivorans]
MTLRIGMVAGEPSGDLLAARVMQGLSARASANAGSAGQPGSHPFISFQGIGGPAMKAQGLDCWHDMAALTVFGYVDALKRLPSLVRTYNNVKSRWLQHSPDVFVGIDAPDFNLRLEHQLKQSGIPTVHFVGPSIWAWRYSRIHKIRQSVSHMLVLFPFEEAIYVKEGIPVTYVGHPLADLIPIEPDRTDARRRLGLDTGAKVLAVLPGSRSSEIRLLTPRFLQAVQILQRQTPGLQVVVPMVNAQRRQEFQAILSQYPVDHLEIIDQSTLAGRPAAWDAMEAADAVLVASGTATLETALFKRPMVISYVLSPMMRRLMAWKSGQEKPYVPWVGLPNVLLNDFAVPELLQDDATPEKLAQACWQALNDPALAASLADRFRDMHLTLKCDTPRLAAEAIYKVATGAAS